MRDGTHEFERVYGDNFALVWRSLRRFGVPFEQLEDAAQEVFLVWHRRQHEFRGDARVATFLYGIARRVAADLRRGTRRAERRDEALVHAASEAGCDVEEALAHRQAVETFERAVRELPEKLREVYVLSEVEGWTAQQIGAAIGASPNTVSSRLRLARRRLTAELRVVMRPAEPSAAARDRVWALIVPLLPNEQVLAPPPASPGRAAQLGEALVAAGTLAAALSVFLGISPRIEAGQPPRALLLAEASPAGPQPGALVPWASAPAAPRVEAPAVPEPAAPRAPVVEEDASGDPLAREASLVAAAQRRLAESDPRTALVLLRAHRRSFARGVLAEEREGLIAAALCGVGDLAGGRAAAERLATRHPDAPALAVARAACDDRN